MMRWREVSRRLAEHELGPGRIAIYLFGFAVAGYAAWRLVPANPVGVVLWFAAAIIAHDLILLPLYGLTHHGALSVLRRRGWAHWVGHLRVPTMMSGILLLVFLPLILDSPDHSRPWLFVSVLLFVVSALLLLTRWGYHRVRTKW